MSVHTCALVWTEYTVSSLLGIFVGFTVILNKSYISFTAEIEELENMGENNIQKGRIIFSKFIVILAFILISINEFISCYNNNGENMTNPSQTEITFVFNGTSLDEMVPIDENAIEDSKYKTNIEEALKTRIILDAEQEYMRNMDEILFQAESDNYVTIYYRSIKNEKLECYTVAKFKKKIFDGVIRYAFLTCTYNEMESNARFVGSFEDNLKNQLISVDYNRDMSVFPGEKRFVWGNTQSEDVFNLKIEGQEPTDIIQYERFGKQWYFWYYDDLQSDKPGSLLEYTIE